MFVSILPGNSGLISKIKVKKPGFTSFMKVPTNYSHNKRFSRNCNFFGKFSCQSLCLMASILLRGQDKPARLSEK